MGQVTDHAHAQAVNHRLKCSPCSQSGSCDDNAIGYGQDAHDDAGQEEHPSRGSAVCSLYGRTLGLHWKRRSKDDICWRQRKNLQRAEQMNAISSVY